MLRKSVEMTNGLSVAGLGGVRRWAWLVGIEGNLKINIYHD